MVKLEGATSPTVAMKDVQQYPASVLLRARKPRYTLDELLTGMTKENIPQEVDWGPQRGNETW